MASNTNGFTVRVPKIASQSKDAQLYNTLKDIVARTNEQLVQCASSADLDLLVESLAALFADGDRGDITVSGEGMVWTIDNLAVTYAKMQQVTATNRLLGRATAGAGVVEEITIGTGLALAGTTLNATVPAFPTGGIVMWGTATAPTGFVLCDGASLSTTTYAALFAVIGYTFGGAGASFNVPDMRQRFPLGKAAAGTGSTLAGTGGAIDHKHSVDIASLDSGSEFPSAVLIDFVTGSGYFYDVSPAHIHDVNPPATDTSTNNPPFLALNFIIKT